MDRQQKAYECFKEGYNCAQAVIMAFADVLPIDEELLLKISSAFGGGFAKTRNLCGAVAGIGMVLGVLKDTLGNVADDKKDIYQKVRSLTDQFEEMNSSLLCGELLKNMKNITKDYVPSERTAEYYATRPCVKFILDATKLTEDYLIEQGIIKE